MSGFPVKNEAFTFPISLVESADRPNFKTPPTLATGDFQVSIDGGAYNNLATLPTVSPAGSENVEVVLSAAEMNGDVIVVRCKDAAGAEWDPVNLNILTGLVLSVWDRVLTGATHNLPTSSGRRLRGIQDFQGYEDGAIWIDTVNGNAGTTDFENGTVENPVDTIADANTLAASLGISKFHIASGSTITFAAAQNNQVFMGNNWTLALGGQDVAGSKFIGATVSGIMAGTGTHQEFEACFIDATTVIKGTHFVTCGIEGTITVGEAGDVFFDRCHSSIAGTSTWVFDFGGAIGSTNVNVRNYSGGIQLENMGDSGTDTMSLEGQGQLIEGTCTSGAVAIRGLFALSGITNLTLTKTTGGDVLTWLGVGVPTLNNATITSSVASDIIEQYRGDSWNITMPALGALTGQTEVWFAIKEKKSHENDQALVRISDNGGLLTINKITAITSANGTLTVTNESTGVMTITLKAVETALLKPGSYKFDIQWKDASGDIRTIADGAFTVIGDVESATS